MIPRQPAPDSGRFASLPEVYASIRAPSGAGFWRRLFTFAGPGYLVAVGYMDPGNWATDIAGGSAFGYALLSVVLLSSLMAMLLQALSLRLGIASGLDLAQACRAHFPSWLNLPLWLLCELAIIACDIAEVIGTAVALQLLFGLPLLYGVLLTAFDVFLLLLLQGRGFRWLEAFIVALLILIAASFAIEIALARPVLADVLLGLVPTPEILRNPAMLYLAVGIMGATVMPHNLYLHSSIVQTRQIGLDLADKRQAIGYATLDSCVALLIAFFVNAAILVLAASAFHMRGMTDVAEIQDAYKLLSPTLGAELASLLFAVALLASGQNSTVTATLAGQVVMEGFLRLRLRPWLRRLATRGLAIIPAALVAGSLGDSGVARLLVLSQVVLSLQLPFAIVPLLWFSGRRATMGALVPPAWVQGVAWAVAAAIVALNLLLLTRLATGGWR